MKHSATLSLREILSGILIAGCISIQLTYISASGPRFDHRDEVIQNQFAILNAEQHVFDGVHRDIPQMQPRVMFPLMLLGLYKLQLLDLSESYIVLRIFTAAMAFFAFYLVCMFQTQRNIVYTTVATTLLAFGLVFTFNHPWEHPTDFLDVLFFSLAIHFVLTQNRAATLLIVLVGTFNHQTMALIGALWFFCYGFRGNLSLEFSETAFSAILTAVSYMLAIGIKVFLGNTWETGYVLNFYEPIRQILVFLNHPTPYSWPILLAAMNIPVALWLLYHREQLDQISYRILSAIACMIIVSTPISFWSEIRSIFLGPYVILCFLAAYCGRIRNGIVGN